MDAETRKRCADALRGATVETLREDADDLLGQVEVLSAGIAAGFANEDDPHIALWNRLAALCLAVAAMQERPTRMVYEDTMWDEEEDEPSRWAVRVPMTMAYERFPTLPAALAALIEGET
jgi:hypothetical protein